VLAHLEKLEANQLVTRADENWSARDLPSGQL
jgi:hypothetical protein